MGVGPLIAIDILLLYLILGPLVLLGIYVMFDSLDPSGKTEQDDPAAGKDPALWTNEDVYKNDFHGVDPDGNRDRT